MPCIPISRMLYEMRWQEYISEHHCSSGMRSHQCNSTTPHRNTIFVEHFEHRLVARCSDQVVIVPPEELTLMTNWLVTITCGSKTQWRDGWSGDRCKVQYSRKALHLPARTVHRSTLSLVTASFTEADIRCLAPQSAFLHASTSDPSPLAIRASPLMPATPLPPRRLYAPMPSAQASSQLERMASIRTYGAARWKDWANTYDATQLPPVASLQVLHRSRREVTDGLVLSALTVDATETANLRTAEDFHGECHQGQHRGRPMPSQAGSLGEARATCVQPGTDPMRLILGILSGVRQGRLHRWRQTPQDIQPQANRIETNQMRTELYRTASRTEPKATRGSSGRTEPNTGSS